MLTGLLRAAFSAFGGAYGFGLLLHAPRKALPMGAAFGALGYTVYWLLPRLGAPDALAMFLGALLAAAAGQLAARRMHMISTVFITIAILPLVPGLGLYRAMSAWGQGMADAGAGIAVASMAQILMIVLGVAVGSALFAARGVPRPPARLGRTARPGCADEGEDEDER